MTGTGGPRGPYAKTAAVQRGILEAAIDVFSESGYWGTTMKEVAERAGISQRGLTHHFASKSDLLKAVLAAREAESAALLPESGLSVDNFTAMLGVVADNSRRPGLIELYTVLTAEGTSPAHPAHDHYRERYHDLRTYFAFAFESLREQGEVVSDLDSDALASAFVALIDGLQTQWLYDRSAADTDTILRSFLTSVVPRFPEMIAESSSAPSAAKTGR